MTTYKVSYGRCMRSTFLTKKRTGKLEPGRLYFIKDTGEILRANSNSTYESYTARIHVVEDWPDNWASNNIYIKSNGRAKIAVEDDSGNTTVVEIKCEGSGGGGGSSPDISDLEADVASIKNRLKWKTPE